MRLGKAARIKAYVDAIMRANRKNLLEAYKMSDMTLDEIFVEVGAAARWEARGKAIGEANGEAIGEEKIARNMLRKGLSVEQVAELSGLDIEKIRKIADS